MFLVQNLLNFRLHITYKVIRICCHGAVGDIFNFKDKIEYIYKIRKIYVKYVF